MQTAVSLLLVWGSVLPGAANNEEIAVDPDRVVGRVSPLIYGQFLEHIYNSVVDGLWGQLVRGPSFEEAPALALRDWTVVRGAWAFDGEGLFIPYPSVASQLFAGNTDWTDYTFSVEAMKEGGPEGFLILFRAADDLNFYWWNLGGWGNASSVVERLATGTHRPIEQTRTGTVIESNRWYSIVVRVTGPKIECYLDGQKLCEFEDTELARGRVGLGSWDTEVRYRNVRVTRGDEMLFTMAASPKREDALAGMWYKVPADGTFRCAWSSENPLNSRYAQRIRTGPDGGGIGQRGLSIEQGVRYTGSVWFRGVGRVHVVLAAGDAKQECRFGVDGQDWREYPLAFVPERSTGDAELTITLDGEGDVWIDQCTLSRVDTPYRPAVYEHVKAIRPAFIRWPGGCYAEFYRWKDAIGPMKGRTTKTNTIWGGLDPNHFGTAEFFELCRDLGAEPVIVLNIGSHEPESKRDDYIQEALDWLEYCNGTTDTTYGALRAAHGHPEPYRVTYWEIGNETWPMGVEAYAECAKRFVAALRAKDKSIKFLVCGSADHDLEWNRRILELAATHMDFLSVHHYCGGSFEDEMKDGVAYPEFQRQTGELIKQSANPAIKIAVTEWNEFSITLQTGLYAGMVLNGFERYGDAVAMSCPALFIRKTDAVEWNNALINHDSHRSFVAPNYLVMKLYRDNYAPERVHADAPDSLNVVATHDPAANDYILKVVNPSATENVRTRVRVGDAYVRHFRQWRVWAPDVNMQNSLAEPERIRVEQTVIESEEVLLPAHSVTVLRFKVPGG